MEQQYLLRVEGVNLGSVLDDTSEISVRRGAGLMLREAIKDIETLYENEVNFKSISVGASTGLFLFESEAPETTLDRVTTLLNKDYTDFTFVADYTELSDDFASAKERVIAKNRLRQFQQITFVPPEPIPNTAGVCEMDLLRPQMPGPKTKTKLVSSACALRFEQGRELRNKFYQDEIGKAVNDTFTSDLSSLAQPSLGQDYGNLNGKIALIYLDGNKFGNIQTKCKDKASLIEFDTKVQSFRCDFLKALLDKVAKDPDFHNHNEDASRLETLLWGGDEMMLVVPAWKGMEVLALFYRLSKAWSIGETDLTHAGGIVFAAHNTPISQLVSAAYGLADNAKDNIKDPQNISRKSGDLFDYLVLESIDYPTQTLGKFWQACYGSGVTALRLPLIPEVFKGNHPLVREALADIPKSVVLEIAKYWCAYRNLPPSTEVDEVTGQPKELTAYEDRVKRFKHVSPVAYATLTNKILPYFDPNYCQDDKQSAIPDTIAWLHLTELWDYIAPIGSSNLGGHIDD